MMGWEGDQVTPQIRSLIADYGLGSIILTAKNLKCRLTHSFVAISMFYWSPWKPSLFVSQLWHMSGAKTLLSRLSVTHQS